MSSIANGSSAPQWPAVEPHDEIRDLYVSLEREFPQAAAEFSDGISRRRWLQLMGASLALSGAAGCRYKVENIAPFVFRPQDRNPGTYTRYATAIDLDGVALPLLVNTVDGRPLKVDGNPEHPDSHGKADIFAQARILDLYDPDRSRAPSEKTATSRREATWTEFSSAISQVLKGVAGNHGGAIAVLAQPNSSPSQKRLRQRFLEKFPAAKWFEYSSVGNDNELQGCKRAFGQPLRPLVAFDKCKIILSIDSDFLSLGGPAIRASHQFVEGRNPDKDWMSRVYAVESQFSLLGALADHRVALAPSQIASFVAALEMGIAANPIDPANAGDGKDKFLAAVISDLIAHKGECCVVGGWSQPPEVQAAIWRVNQALGNIGSTISFAAAEDRAPYVGQLAEMIKELEAGLTTLLILDGNPVYDAPVDLKFAESLKRVQHSVYIGLTENETSRECGWFANISHPLEAWGDGRSYDGSFCIAQPMIAPLYGSRSMIEFLSSVLGEEKSGLEIVRETASAVLTGESADDAWSNAVHNGFIDGTAEKPVEVTLIDTQRLTPLKDWKSNWEGGSLELVFAPSRQLFDGRFANSGWLQELPDFVTKLTWDNAAVVSPKTARLNNLSQAHMVKIELDGKRIDLPVHIQPGHANGTVTVALGYGRWMVGRVGGDEAKGIPLVGANAGLLRNSANMYSRPNVDLVEYSGRVRLALSQDPYTLDAMGRKGIRDRLGGNSPLIRSGTFDQYREFVAQHGPMVDEAELKTEHDPDWSGHATPVPKESAKDSRKLTVINASNPPDQDEHGGESAAGHDHAGDHDTHWPQGLVPHFENKSLSPGPKYSATHKWAMSIDLSKCIGCNACVIACQAENNVPIVGKEQVVRGREMSWIRIDAYVIDDPQNDPDAENAEFKFQPVTCQHCENAPCETVCPVAATVHSTEGLNDMVYNRCIGTRYCGNNCPYKVRRFNYLNYTEAVTLIKYPNEGIYNEQEKQMRGLGMNPEVTVRSRGVMEKCTYCVQRIQNTRILARNEQRPIGPNEITTACQDACPTGAIVFGNMADRQSDVHKNHRSVRAYQLLDQLGNIPRTRYLARVRNPNPALLNPATTTESHS